MKKNIVLTLAFALFVSGVPAAAVFAESGQGEDGTAGLSVSASAREGSDDGIDGKTDDHINASTTASSEVKSKDREQEREHATSTASSTNDREDDQGELTSDEHRSAVATTVHSLLELADREDSHGHRGIGDEVRLVAKAQNDTIATTTIAIEQVSSRSALLTLLIGSDYKNLGELRSSIATTSANISHLEDLRDKATTDADKAAIDAQITALKDQQVKLDAFVTTHENAFSLFGWFVKLFSK